MSSLELCANLSQRINRSDLAHFYASAQWLTGLVIYPLVCTFGILGNIFSILIIWRSRVVSSTNIFLIALGVSDTIKLLNDMLYFVTVLCKVIDQRLSEQLFIQLYPYSHYVFQVSACTTAWLTVSIAIERYIMVCRPTKAKKLCSMKRTKLNVGAVFAVMSIMCVPSVLRYERQSVCSRADGSTKFDIVPSSSWKRFPTLVTAYNWILNFTRPVFPILIISVLNFLTVRGLRRIKTPRTVFIRYRITLMLLAIVFIYVLCGLPDAILSTIFGFGYVEEDYLVKGIREITDTFMAINCASNVILYFTFNTIFKKQFVATFCRKCVRRRHEIHFETSSGSGKLQCLVKFRGQPRSADHSAPRNYFKNSDNTV